MGGQLDCIHKLPRKLSALLADVGHGRRFP
jgi:hypothetical protein